MKKKKSVKAVFFDAGNTLLRPFPSVGHIYAKTAGRHGVRITVAGVEERFQAAWRDRHSPHHLKSDQADKSWWRVLVHRVMGSHFSENKFHRYFEDLYHRFAHPQNWRLFPDALPTLRALRQKNFSLGIVSNWDSRLLVLSERIGLTKEVAFVLASAVEGVAKPDKKLFQKALKQARVSAPEALHVGDSFKEDYEGATKAGLRALLLDRQGVPLKGVTTIRSLKEVLSHATERITPSKKRPVEGKPQSTRN
jgi:putative hydrolase of the HAD superfamily